MQRHYLVATIFISTKHYRISNKPKSKNKVLSQPIVIYRMWKDFLPLLTDNLVFIITNGIIAFGHDTTERTK